MNNYYYHAHPETCDPKDYWSQVKRTVDGKPVDDAQIDLIVGAVCAGLHLEVDDFLLDLCCGNGALSDLFFRRCAGGVGVDFSEYLIGIAKQDFQHMPDRSYELCSANDYLEKTANPERFTKALCYGGFMFFDDADARRFLCTLRQRFSAIERLFLGNLPDKERMSSFFREGEYKPGIENDASSPIGIWRSVDEFVTMARECGWQATVSRMPDSFFAARYRYDMILHPTGLPAEVIA